MNEGLLMLLGFIGSSLTILLAWCIYRLRPNISDTSEVNRLKYERALMKCHTDLQTFIMGLITIVCTTQFHDYIANHDGKKITRGQITAVVEKAATEVYEVIQLDHLEFNNILLKEEFYHKLIVDQCGLTINELLDKYIQLQEKLQGG